MPSTSPTPKPTLPTLKTPCSAGPLPSELPRSPLPGWVERSLIKEELDLKTPITPPTAYTDFLKALSPAVSTPSTSLSNSFSDRSDKSTPTSQPSSAGSLHSCSCERDKENDKEKEKDISKSASAPLIPPSPFVRSQLSRTPSARTPTSLRRLRIPQSPMYSPATDSPKSSAMRSPFSPADWIMEGKTRYYHSPRSAHHTPVSVRQVVTRTVTYTRTPLDPAPKGKRRKLE